MAINDNNGNRSARSTRRPSLFDLNTESFFQTLQPSSPVLEKFQNLLMEAFKKADDTFEFWSVPIVHEQLAAPALAVLVAKKDARDKGMGVHVVIFETDEVELSPRMINYQDKTFTLERTMGDIADRSFFGIVDGVLAEKFLDTRFHGNSARVVYRTTKLDDPVEFHRLAFSIASAASTDLLLAMEGLTEINLGELEATHHNLKIEHALPTHYDEVGLPVRSDVKISLQVKTPTPLSSPARHLEIGYSTGFLDVIPVPDNKFMPRFVITRIEPGKHMADLLSFQMMMIATTTALSENNAWQEALIRPNLSGLVPRDLTMLHPDLTLEALGDQERTGKIFADAFHPGLVFSMDVANAGCDTWRRDVWAAAAHGSSAADEHLFRTANHLTNGRFGAYIQQGTRLVITEENQIPMGYVHDRLGDKIDIREVDQLMVMTMTHEKDPKISADWADTYLRQEWRQDVRVAQRIQMLRGLLGQPVFTDMATRVTFTAEFIQALRAGLRDVGFSVRIPTVERQTVADYQFGAAAIVPNNDSKGLFQSTDGFRGPFSGRSRY
jgi:hypothetical protein